MRIREVVEEERRRSGRSMRTIAIQAGIEPGLFNSYVQGKRPNQKNAKRVAAALRTNVHELFPDFDQLRKY